MGVTRRDFFKISGAGAAGLALSQLGFDLSPVETYAQELQIKGAKENLTVCCFCSVGCGIIVHTDAKGQVINAEGD
ncbi:MAG: twin-arginine translocation signal domain-containing protein, partial [Desulfobacterota bacterium]|nr:twin-arginine translocation signal domain-containing protein [Thermodesulfobacteriota bacterium]